MQGFKHSHITERIIGAAFKVHNTLGNGFQEVIYQRALAIEMGVTKLNFMREYEMPIFYLDQHIGTRRVDFLVEDIISVELKAITKLEDVHLSQAINYLEAYNLEIGLLINFGSKRLEFHRFTNKKYNASLINHPFLSNQSQSSQ
jgi:GxxExxY protein